MTYVPGNAAEGHCTTCKADTVHTVLEVEGLQVRLVRCEKCRAEGPLKVPRARAKAGLLDVARKRGSIPPPKRTRRKPADPAQIFRKLIEGKELAQAPKYSTRLSLEMDQVIDHPSFGIGVVTAMNEKTKATITFEDGSRVLVCNKK